MFVCACEWGVVGAQGGMKELLWGKSCRCINDGPHRLLASILSLVAAEGYYLKAWGGRGGTDASTIEKPLDMHNISSMFLEPTGQWWQLSRACYGAVQEAEYKKECGFEENQLNNNQVFE